MNEWTNEWMNEHNSTLYNRLITYPRWRGNQFITNCVNYHLGSLTHLPTTECKSDTSSTIHMWLCKPAFHPINMITAKCVSSDDDNNVTYNPVCLVFYLLDIYTYQYLAGIRSYSFKISSRQQQWLSQYTSKLPPNLPFSRSNKLN